MKERIPFIINDFIFLEEICNLRCGYCGGCPGAEPNPKIIKGRIEIKGKNLLQDHNLMAKIGPLTTASPKELFELGIDSLRKLNSSFDYPLLKISGGEVFMFSNLMEEVAKISYNYNGVQILSNGTMIKERDIDIISECENIIIQVSLDGSSPETNFARTKSIKHLETILKNLSLMDSKGIGLEINCVLTKYNTGEFKSMLDYFLPFENLTIFPRPVRGIASKDLKASTNQIDCFSELHSQYYKYAHIMPPIEYFDRIHSILKSGHRSWQCHVPLFVLGANIYGELFGCTSNGPELGNIHASDGTTLVNNNKINQKAFPSCHDCTNQYELFNLYFDNQIEEKDLLKISTYKIPGVIEKMRVIKELHKASEK